MNKNNLKSKLKYIFLSVIVACIGSLPFFLFSDTLKNLSAVSYIGLLIATFLTNASVLLPASGIAFTLSASYILDPLICVIVGGLGTALGEMVSYICGRNGSAVIDDIKKFEKVSLYLKKYDMIIVFIFALLPLPIFDIVGIAAGSAKMSIPKYLIACFTGKTIKLFVYVFLLKNFLPMNLM